MRADLPRGIQAANILHAAGESSPGNLTAGTIAVALMARDEPHLRALLDALTRAALARVVPIYEPDPPYLGQLMAIGIEPVTKEVRAALRRHLSTLPTLR